MTTVKREPGYYWVKHALSDKLEIAYKGLNFWFREGARKAYNEDEFQWIDKPENRLTPPEDGKENS